MKFRFILLTALVVTFSAVMAIALDLRDVTYTSKGGGKVIFSHKQHIRQKGINNNCKACHDAIFSMRKRVTYTMADMDKGKSCGACHGKSAFSLKDCARCHKVKDVIFQVKATGPTRFSHNVHLPATPTCGTCHPALFPTGPTKPVTMAEMGKGKSCGACHNGKKAFSLDKCTTCHPVKEISFQVKETGPTPFSHKKHIEMYQCGDCHTRLFAAGHNKRVTMAEMEKGKSCGACHNGKDGFSVADCSKCHAVKDVEFKVTGAGNAKFSHKVHMSIYKCSDCHARIYPQGKKKSKPVSMQAMGEGKSCGACHDGKTAFTVREDCLKCHPSM